MRGLVACTEADTVGSCELVEVVWKLVLVDTKLTLEMQNRRLIT